MNNNNNEPLRKKTYTKPEVTQVDLRPDEAVLGDCKNPATGGPNEGGNCAQLGGCSTQGS